MIAGRLLSFKTSVKKNALLILLAAVICIQCSSSHTVLVTKPRYHKSWYKDHRWRKKIKVGRIHIPLFEKQGVKKVRMKG